MGSRLLFAVAILVLCTSSAFAGPQIVISDPLCTGSSSEISLTSPGYSFTFSNGQASLTFCNNTTTTFTSLNFTISSATQFDLGGFYCGAPDDHTVAAFDSCLVLDPTTGAPAGQNGQLFYGNQLQPNELVLHQFVTSYPKPTFPYIPFSHDGPSDFYQNNDCYYGCGSVVSQLGNEVHLSFDLLTPLNLRPAICLQFNQETNIPCGLLPNHQFTLTFACDPNNTGTGTAIPCDSLPDGAGVSFLASTSPDQVTFPAPVPEPTTLLLIASAGIPAFLRRRKKS
jgi:hypothetical protein